MSGIPSLPEDLFNPLRRIYIVGMKYRHPNISKCEIGGYAIPRLRRIVIQIYINEEFEKFSEKDLPELFYKMEQVLVHELTHFWKINKGEKPPRAKTAEQFLNYVLSSRETEAMFSGIRTSINKTKDDIDRIYGLTDIINFVNSYVSKMYKRFSGEDISQDKKEEIVWHFVDYAKERYPEMSRKMGLYAFDAINENILKIRRQIRESEPFQQKVKKNHKRMKFKLIGMGGNKHKESGVVLPSYERGKSAPPIGESKKIQTEVVEIVNELSKQ